MKKRTGLLVLAALLAAAVSCFAATDVNMGTWKLDEAKSKIPAGVVKNSTVVYEAAGDSVKITVDGVDGDGKPLHTEWTGKFDGKDYAVTGDATTDMRSYKRINSHVLELTNKKDGKVILTARVVVSADGKSRTLTSHGKNAKGEKVMGMAYYDKQ